MTTKNEPAAREEEFSLPLDLTEWVEKTKLLEWIEEEVEKFDWANPELVAYLQRDPEYRPKMLLALLAYAYSTQIFGAEEIVRRCYGDVVFRLICDNAAPSGQEITRFRRENRGLLRGLLLAVFVRVVKAQFELGDAWLPPGIKRYLLNSAVERLNIARHMDTVEE